MCDISISKCICVMLVEPPTKSMGARFTNPFMRCSGQMISLVRSGCVAKNIEKENSPLGGSVLNHVDIFTKSDIIIGFIYRGIRVAFGVIIDAYLLVAYDFLEIIPVPFLISWPFFCKVCENNRLARLIKMFFKIMVTDGSYLLNRL
jgi:hypothetical protein